MIERIVVDSSPLIVLLKSDLAEILPQLYGKVLIPDAVWNEVLAGKEKDPAKVSLPSLPWITRVSVKTTSKTHNVQGLGRGELEAITAAMQFADTLLLIDDFAARSFAKEMGIPFIGTGGLLIQAKKKSLIPSVSKALEAVRECGLWVDERTIALLKLKAGE